jgi:hypothetical protein
MAEVVPQVISEIIAGDSLTLAQVAARVPSHRGEGHSTPSRISRWVNPGHKLPGGRVVKLEAAKFGAAVLTSKAALERFIAAINSDAQADAPQQPKPRSEAERRRAAEAAEQRLAKAGA